MASNQSTQGRTYHSFEMWEQGESQAHQTATSLLQDLEEINQVISGFEAIKARLRDQLSRIVASQGDKLELSDGYKLVLTAPGKTISYDRKKLDELVVELAGNDDEDLRLIASRLAGLRNEAERAGSLRVEVPKRRKEDREAA